MRREAHFYNFIEIVFLALTTFDSLSCKQAARGVEEDRSPPLLSAAHELLPVPTAAAGRGRADSRSFPPGPALCHPAAALSASRSTSASRATAGLCCHWSTDGEPGRTRRLEVGTRRFTCIPSGARQHESGRGTGDAKPSCQEAEGNPQGGCWHAGGRRCGSAKGWQALRARGAFLRRVEGCLACRAGRAPRRRREEATAVWCACGGGALAGSAAQPDLRQHHAHAMPRGVAGCDLVLVLNRRVRRLFIQWFD